MPMLGFHASDELVEKVQEKATEERRSISSTLRIIVEDFFANAKEVVDEPAAQD